MQAEWAAVGQRALLWRVVAAAGMASIGMGDAVASVVGSLAGRCVRGIGAGHGVG